ncbi:MAG: DUF348 domain-containing protein [Clostridiales bacterium]|nr:DUF348 domain-containing protein [Clostridiales bacterium]
MIPLAKNIKRLFSFKETIFMAAALIFSVLAGYTLFSLLEKDVTINDNGRYIEVKTMVGTVDEVLEQNGVTITSDDYTSMALDEKLQTDANNLIDIKRAVPVKIIADGCETTLMTYEDTVGEALEKSPVKPSGLDRLENVSTEDKITKDMTIKITRVQEQYVTETESIPYETVKQENERLNSGTERTVRQGVEGQLEKQYQVVTQDGREVVKKMVKETLLSSPVSAIVEIGTVLNHKTSRGDVLRYKEVLSMRATAYTASYKDTGKNPGDPGFGITRTGIKTKRGVIAVDPRVIPLGTRVYVEVAGSTPDYGYAVAADTGGAIKGNLIDLYYDTQSFVDSWGCKKVKVYILLDE